MAAPEPVEIGVLIEQRSIGALQWRVVLLCALISFLDGFDTQVMALTVPAIAADWRVGSASFSLVLSASLVGLGLGAGLLAPLGDRYGRRPLLIWSMLLVGLSTCAIAAATDVWLVAALRFLTGIGVGVGVANSSALVSDYLPASRRAALVTLVFCASAVGAILAGFTAPYLIDRWGWPMVFLVGGVPAVLGTVLLQLSLPESVRILLARRPGDPRIAPLLRRLCPDIPLPLVIADEVKVVVKASLFSLLTPGLLPRTLTIWGLFALNLFTVYVIVSWIPTLLMGAGWPQAQALRGAAAIQFGGLLGGLVIALVAARGFLREGLAVAFVVAAGCLGLLLATLPSVLLWSVLLILAGAGTVGSQFAINGLAASMYPAAIRATGLGWALVVGRISAIAAPIVGGFMIHAGIAPGQLLGFLAAPVVCCALLAMQVRRQWLRD